MGKRTEAEVDVVVRRGQGANLSWIRVGTLTILSKTRRNDGRVKCQRGLGVLLATDPCGTRGSQGGWNEDGREGDKGD